MPTYHSISWNWQKWHLHLKILWGLKSTCWTGVRTQRSWRHLTRDQAENHQSRSSNFSLAPRPPRPSKVKTREHPQTFIDVLITRKDWATFSWFACPRHVGVISLSFFCCCWRKSVCRTNCHLFFPIFNCWNWCHYITVPSSVVWKVSNKCVKMARNQISSNIRKRKLKLTQ